MKLSERTSGWAYKMERLTDDIAQLEAHNADLQEALKLTNMRLWTRRFEFSDADHAAMDAASEALKATEDE
jgi:chromosome segregation ATPase